MNGIESDDCMRHSCWLQPERTTFRKVLLQDTDTGGPTSDLIREVHVIFKARYELK